jgi:hypothetical protein
MSISGIITAVVTIVLLGMLIPIGGGVAWTGRWIDTAKGVGIVLGILMFGGMSMALFR